MDFKKTTLSNGVRVITVPLKENQTVTVSVFVEAGSKYESKEINGVSHFLEHMCFKGTEKRPTSLEISHELDSIGSQYNAFTAQECTCYFAKAHSKHFSKLVDIVSDIFKNPSLPLAELEKERGVIIEEINMYNDLPQRKIQDVFMSLLYGDQPAGWNITGTKENVLKIQREDFLNYREKFYVASSTLVVISGNFDEKNVIKEIEEKFNGINENKGVGKARVLESQNAPALLCEEKVTEQTHFVLGTRAFDVNHKDNPVLRVLTGVLGGGMSSRLFQKMREDLGICYYVSASADLFTDHGFFSVSAGVKNDRLFEAVKAILVELRNMKEKSVLESELKKTKDFLVGNMYLDLESSDSLANFYGFQEILKENLKKPEEIAKEIESVSAVDIKRLACDVFEDRKLNFALIGPSFNKGELSKILKF